jgi:hypothetical protein
MRELFSVFTGMTSFTAARVGRMDANEKAATAASALKYLICM